VLDVRLPIGLLFLAVGILLAGYGYACPPVELLTLFNNALPINLNVIWGIFMTLFGLMMFSLAKLDKALAAEKQLIANQESGDS
jgi:hypothetical protein